MQYTKDRKELLASVLVFLLLLLVVLPTAQIFFIRGYNLHFIMRSVFLLQKINYLAALSMIILIFLVIRTGTKNLPRPRIEPRILLIALAFFILSFSTQNDINKILNEGVYLGIEDNSPRINLDSNRLFNINVLDDIDVNARFISTDDFGSGNRIVRKILMLTPASSQKFSLGLFGKEICEDCDFFVAVNDRKLNITDSLRDLKPLSANLISFSVPVAFLKQGTNTFDFYGSGHLNSSLHFFTQTIYINSNTYNSNDGGKTWERNTFDELALYLEKENPLYYRILFKFGFIFRLLAVAFLFIGCFGIGFTKRLFSHNKKELAFSTVIAFVAYFISFGIRSYWIYLSKLVAYSVYFMLKLFFRDVVINLSNPNLPFVGANGFVLGIAETCSGIDSIAFFSMAYFALTLFYWKSLRLRLHLMLFLPGLIGAFLINILRVFMIFLVGLFISKEFAVNSFHTNIGMILFSVYFLIYWFGIISYQDRKN